MLNGRLYRAALLPFLIALGVAAFSLQGRPLPLTSSFSPDAFQGARAFAQMRRLALKFPNRRPGSAGDERLAALVAREFREAGSAAGGGFSVRTRIVAGQTIDGERELTLVVAERPGSTAASPIVILAHRDAAAPGSEAELSGTAVLLELARVFAARETKRAIVLVSSSGGSGGGAAATAVAGLLHGSADAAIVLGDLAAAHARRPIVIPFSDGYGTAPLELPRTVSDAIMRQTGSDPGSPSVFGQLAHLVFPLAPGEQGALNAAGLPAVLVQASGERGPAARETVSSERLEGLGRSVLFAVDALDAAPGISPGSESGIVLSHKVLPSWAVGLLVFTSLLAPLVAVADGLARVRRRRLPIGRGTLWCASCALPFLSCALLVYILGLLRILGTRPPVPALPAAMPFDGAAATVVMAVGLTFLLAWLLWAMLLRRVGLSARPDGEVAGLGVLLLLVPLGLIVWLINPYAALLIVPAAHLWLLLASPELRPSRGGSIALLALGVLPLGLLIAFYADQLGMGPGDVAWMAVLLLAGGHVGFPAALLWSLGLGCAAAAGILALARSSSAPPPGAGPERLEVTIRGPMSYAGPGSLGGTESALRR